MVSPPPALSARRRLAFYAILWGVTLLSVFAVVLTYYIYRGEALPRLPIRVKGRLGEPDDEIGAVPELNGAVEMRRLDLNTQWHLFRDRLGARVNRPGDQTPNRVDVIAVGCSYTEGLGVENEDSWPEQLQRLLGATTANLGNSGYSSIQSFQMLRRHVDLRPRFVIYGFMTDHLRRNVSPCATGGVPYCAPVPYFESHGGIGEAGHIRPPRWEFFDVNELIRLHEEVSLRDGESVLDKLLAAKWALRMDLFHYRVINDVAYDGSIENTTAAIRFVISEMAKTTRAIGAELIVLYIPEMQPVHTMPPPESLLEAVSENHVPLVDMTPTILAHLEQRPEDRLDLGPEEEHPNALAYRLIAQELAGYLRPKLKEDTSNVHLQ